jgi:hypothetical protein
MEIGMCFTMAGVEALLKHLIFSKWAENGDER